MKAIKALSIFLEKTLEKLLVVLVSAIVIDVTWQVLTRFLFRDPSSYTEELARYLLMWIGLLGAAYAYRKHSHLSLDLMLHSVSREKQKLLLRFIHTMSFFFAAVVMVFGGFKLMALTFNLNQTSAALGVPIGGVYTCLPISGFLICWFALENIIVNPIPEQFNSETDQPADNS